MQQQLMTREAMNLKESGKKHMGGLGGKKRNGDTEIKLQA